MNYPKLDLSDWTISDNPKHKLNNKSTLITINSYYNTIKKTLEIMPFPKPTSYTLLKKNLPLLKLHLTTDIVERRIRKNRKLSESKNNLWENRIFLDYFNDYYVYFYEKIEPRTRLCKISGNLSLEEIEKFIRKDMNEK